MTSESQLFPSNVAGRQYRELDIVGQGGESLVYKAVQVDDGVEGRIVAVKECSIKTTREKGWKIYDRFKRQADFMHQLKHPNIVDFQEFVEGNGRFLELYLIMEFLEGQNLRQRLHTNAKGEGRALPLDELVRVNEQVIGALEHAHSKNIVHRDLKPEQIMVRPDGTVKLLDFGAGKAISGGDTATLLTSAGATYQYAAPEQLGFFKESYSPATDAYAFSVMLYEMLAGHQLPRSDENFHHTIPNGVNLGRFREIIERGIAWEPDKRATLDEFRRVIGGEKRALVRIAGNLDAKVKEAPQPQLQPSPTAITKSTDVSGLPLLWVPPYARKTEVEGNLIQPVGFISIANTVGGDQFAGIGAAINIANTVGRDQFAVTGPALNYAHKVGGDQFAVFGPALNYAREVGENQGAGIGAAINIANTVGRDQFAGFGAALNIANTVGRDQFAVTGPALNYAHKVGRDQFAVFGPALNYAREVGENQGAGIGAAINIANTVGRDQFAGFGAALNIANTVGGSQVAVVCAINYAHEIRGNQFAVTGCAVNVAQRVGKGQYGLVNICTKKLGKRQVGIVNYAEGEEFKQYGLLNIRPGKKDRWNVEISLGYHHRKAGDGK